jgi:hypothetical protein
MVENGAQSPQCTAVAVVRACILQPLPLIIHHIAKSAWDPNSSLLLNWDPLEVGLLKQEMTPAVRPAKIKITIKRVLRMNLLLLDRK